MTHFSDWHGETHALPSADVYVCTGDMLPNSRAWRWVDKEPEQRFQRQWMFMNGRGEYNAKALAPGAHVIVVRGNHDFLDLKLLWRELGPNRVHELVGPEIVTIDGVRFGGFRGVRRIDGEQSDECTERELEAKCDELTRLGSVDVLVTHGPAFDRLDNDYGSRALRDFVDGRFVKKPKAHLFGHIHERKGVETIDGVLFSNAATGVNVVEL